MMNPLTVLVILGQVFLFTLAFGMFVLFLLFLWENQEITEQIHERERFFR